MSNVQPTHQPQRNTFFVYLPRVMIGIALGTFIAWCIASTVFMVQSTLAVRSTTVMCADRMVGLMDERNTLQQANIQLNSEVIFMRGRLQTFETLYGMSKKNYQASVGGGP